ncbi:iron complex outermembrane recepter protein [Marinobacter sp. LV10R510-11A]|uniref:TonB-dependent receptor family protein n=1 Tax=Marinobacter sp. LV10R510-11A TaxID=1415568 RepID=UPI000BB7DAA2|nr:TonB-dependent receptor [Marinobacter sp. LV10R510-11A]SOB75543.1 iron complex outermembrane recepter protein [Marinobacter sp. LV10R510-11A]
MKIPKYTSLFLSGLIAPSITMTAYGQPPADIVVTSPVMERALYETPAAMSVVQQEAIHEGQPRLKLDESLGQVPGIFLQNQENFAQGERIAIRGFGARAPFGVRGVTVMVDGIPYTLPDGQAQLDAIDLDSAERIEVIRGPASVLYGNAAGGVISVTTADGRRKPEGTSVRLTGGSDSFGKVSVSNSQNNGPWSHNISTSALNYEGYRDQAKVEKYLLNTKMRREFDNDRSVTAIINLLQNPRSEDPGALTAEQVEADRSQAGKFTEKFDTGQTVNQQVLGLQYQDLSAGPGELRVKTFYMRRNFEQQLPYPGDSRIDYDRDYFGARADYRQALELAGLPFRYVAGVEAREQRDDRIRTNMFTGDLEGLVADELQTATALSTFAQGDLSLNEQLTLSLGVRFDRVRMKIDDDYPRDDDPSGSQSFNEWSGSAGLSYRYLTSHQAYANISTAFETPTFSEFANPSRVGGLNPDVEPQKSLNHELGLRGEFSNGIDYDLTLFWIDVRDELIPYKKEDEDEDDRTFYRNAGDTTRKGFEAAVGWLLTPGWRVDSALTLASYEFDTYRLDHGNDGNRLPGLPEQTWSNRLQWHGLGGTFATLESHYVGSMVADDANDTKVDDYWLVNLRAGNTLYAGQNLLLKGFAGIRNLTDRNHFANVRINAKDDRYFEPAAGRTWYAGVEFTF